MGLVDTYDDYGLESTAETVITIEGISLYLYYNMKYEWSLSGKQLCISFFDKNYVYNIADNFQEVNTEYNLVNKEFIMRIKY